MENNETIEVERKPYHKPEIVHEQDLETRAGTPIPGFPLDPPGSSG